MPGGRIDAELATGEGTTPVDTALAVDTSVAVSSDALDGDLNEPEVLRRANGDPALIDVAEQLWQLALVIEESRALGVKPGLGVRMRLATLGVEATAERRARLLGWTLLGLACGMGFLTKGFLAWLLPVLVALPYMLWQRRWRELLGYGALAVLAALLVCLPWALAVHAREADYWRFFFWHEHIRRFAGEDAQQSASLGCERNGWAPGDGSLCSIQHDGGDLL